MQPSKTFPTTAIQPEIGQISVPHSDVQYYPEGLLAASAQVFGMHYQPHLNAREK